MENSQVLNTVSSEPSTVPTPAMNQPIANADPASPAASDFCSLKWILSQSILKSRPFAVVTDELLHAAPLDIRAAAESVAEPAGYLVVPVSSRAALLENVVNQVLARIAVETDGIHDKPVARKDAEAQLRALIATPDQRVALVIQNGEQVPAETYRGLAKALRAVTKSGSEDPNSLPSMVVVIGAESDFFKSLKGQLVLSILGEYGVLGDDGAGMVKLLENHSELQTDSDTAWQLTRERLGRDAPVQESSFSAVKPENSLVVVDPINSPRSRTPFYFHFPTFASIGVSIGTGISSLFSGRTQRKKMSGWMNQNPPINTRKTPTFHTRQPTPTPAQLK